MNTERGKIKRRRGGKSENRRIREDKDKERQRDGQTDKRTDRRQTQIDRKKRKEGIEKELQNKEREKKYQEIFSKNSSFRLAKKKRVSFIYYGFN